MTFPEPREGMVIRYSYLWQREHERGREEGLKERPCAIVLSVIDREGRHRVVVAPVTHSPPANSNDAIEIPALTKARLGLDEDQSWIVINEANRFTWPGPDLRPIPGRDISTIIYGMLPPDFFIKVRTAFLRRFTQGRVRPVPRTE